jgi:heme oxygenase
MTRLVASLIILQSLCFSTLAFVSRSPLKQGRDAFLPLHATTQAEKAEATKAENPRLSGLAFMLDTGTRKSHSMAENTAFVTGFFKGLANRDSYGALLTSLFFVYTAMEESMDETSEDGVRTLDYPALRRLPSLERDMQFFYGENWRSQMQPSPAAKTYVARIEQVAKTKPYLLVAHQYTRYLGDLFGT